MRGKSASKFKDFDFRKLAKNRLFVCLHFAACPDNFFQNNASCKEVPHSSKIKQKKRLFWALSKRYTSFRHEKLSKIADGAVVITISLFPGFPGLIPERGKKRRFL